MSGKWMIKKKKTRKCESLLYKQSEFLRNSDQCSPHTQYSIFVSAGINFHRETNWLGNGKLNDLPTLEDVQKTKKKTMPSQFSN